jgi:hypothetical protein
MDNKNTKYDDLALMQYADGELDSTTYKQLKKDLVDNDKLQERLSVFTLTREALISTNNKIPKHIEELINKQDKPAKKGNEIIQFFNQYPLQSLAASVMFGLLIGAQGMKGIHTSPYSDILINRPISEYQSISKEATNNQAKTAIKIQRNSNDVVLKLIKSLSKNPNIKQIPFSYKDKDSYIEVVAEFKNSNGQTCKIAQTKDLYLIACINKSGGWSVEGTK